MGSLHEAVKAKMKNMSPSIPGSDQKVPMKTGMSKGNMKSVLSKRLGKNGNKPS